MSKMLRYTGPADSYELAAADFKKAGVEDARKVRFPQGESVEVDDAVADAILSDEGPFAGFSAVFEEADDSASEADTRNAPEGTADDAEMTESGRESTSEGTGITTTPRSSRRGGARTAGTTGGNA